MPENTGQKQKKSLFRKGQSGNPNGRPSGSKNKTSLMAEMLFAENLQCVCNAVIMKAKLGDMQAAKIIFDKLLPPRKERLISIRLPKVKTPKDILKAVAAITQAIANAEIAPSEGEALARILDIHARAIELHDFEKTLNELNEQKDLK
jgi:hypothetical protein